ncbi:MAG: peptidoglycan editing factor PgeF [Sporolactobacillus sp.]
MKEVFSIEERRAIRMETVQAGRLSIHSGFSLRDGGKSREPFSSLNLGLHVGDNPLAVLANRELLARDIGFPLERWVCAEQVHGTEVVRVSSADAGSGARDLQTVIKGADGLITTEANLLLALCYADCVPVYFYTVNPPAVAMLHAGWRGTVGGGARKMVAALIRELNLASAKEIHVIIGPAIGQIDYEVDEHVMNQVFKLDEELFEPAVQRRGSGHYLLSLQTLNRTILLQAGVPAEQIKVTAYTTYADPDLFYSFRRDKGQTGRMIGYIGLKNEGEGHSDSSR